MYEPNTNLKNHEAILHKQIEKEVKVLAIYVCVTKKDNHNLNPSQKELIQWHFILGHIWFQHVQLLIFTGRPKVQSNYKTVYNCERPKCAAYEFGKGYCQSNKVNRIKNNPMKDPDINKDHLLPGHILSEDHYI